MTTLNHWDVLDPVLDAPDSLDPLSDLLDVPYTVMYGLDSLDPVVDLLDSSVDPLNPLDSWDLLDPLLVALNPVVGLSNAALDLLLDISDVLDRLMVDPRDSVVDLLDLLDQFSDALDPLDPVLDSLDVLDSPMDLPVDRVTELPESMYPMESEVDPGVS